MVKVELKPKDGFDWGKVTWGRPDSPVSAVCSYCSAAIGDDYVPLRMWTEQHYAAQFCDECQRKWFGLQ
jgi:hypothetical protein